MKFTIKQFSSGKRWMLATHSSTSHYGIPAFRYTGCSCPDRGPADQLCVHAWPPALIEWFGPWTAADAVYTFLRSETRTPEQMTSAQMFLRQWPNGPQL